MSDITKCVNEGCPMRKTCWRWIAPGSERQAVAEFEPDLDGTCGMYWAVDETPGPLRRPDPTGSG